MDLAIVLRTVLRNLEEYGIFLHILKYHYSANFACILLPSPGVYCVEWRCSSVTSTKILKEDLKKYFKGTYVKSTYDESFSR